MSKEYKTIRVPKPVFAELEGVKREGETWEGLMRRLLDARNGSENPTELFEFIEEFRKDIDMIPERTAEKTADELEGRMR